MGLQFVITAEEGATTLNISGSGEVTNDSGSVWGTSFWSSTNEISNIGDYVTSAGPNFESYTLSNNLSFTGGGTTHNISSILLDYDYGTNADDFGIAFDTTTTLQANTTYTLSGSATFDLTGNDTFSSNNFNFGTYSSNSLSGGWANFSGNSPIFQLQISQDTSPKLSSSTPADNATAIATTSNIVLNFSKAVDVETGNIVIYKASDNSVVETIDVTSNQVTGSGSTQITINPSSDLAEQTEYYVQIAATAFDDSSNASYAGISDATSLSFTTVDETAPTISGPSGGINDSTFTGTSINENETSIYTFSADETVTWSLIGGADAALFAINSSSGALTFSSAPDRESPNDNDSNNIYEVQIRATDSSNNFSDHNIEVSITDVIEDDGDASFSIVGTKSVGNYLSIKRDSQDPDGTGKLSYQWQSSSDGSAWSNVSTKSTYRLKYTDSDKYYKATISYTDDDGFSETITTDTIQIDKHSIHTSLDSLKSQLSNLSYSTSYDYTSLGYTEEFGTSSGETHYAGANEIVWGLGGDDYLRNSYSLYDQYLIGGSGNDTYRISGTAVAIIYEAPNHGTEDILYLSSYIYYYGYAASIDNKHLVAIYDDQAVFVLDAWENTGIEQIYLGNYGYTSSYFLNLLPSLPGYLGNVSWDEIKPYAGDLVVEAAKRVIDEIKSTTITVESDFETSQSSLNSQISSLESQASDLNQSTEEVVYTNQSVGTSYHLTAIRDYDGNFHANTGSVSDDTKTSYKYQGLIDVNADGTKEAIYTNKESGRWVTASINSSTGEIDYSDHGQGGTTRVVGIYIDPLVQEGIVEQFGPHDSQRRFQNDLYIDNLIAKTSGDYDGDGFQEVYWKTNDGTAYLRALMHADGNIQYANYQNEEQMSDYLTSKGYADVISDII